MSAPNQINNSPPSNNNIPLNPHASKWQHRTVSVLDKFTWLLGAVLIITGIVLFILNSLYSVDLYFAALTATSVGSGVFVIGVVLNCCVAGDCLKSDKIDTRSNQYDASPHIKVEPLNVETTAKAFFEKKGLFGLPETFIDEIESWRKFRTTGNFSTITDAGFILEGPPGTGKTTVSKAIGEILGGEYVEKKCGDLLNPPSKAESQITQLFAVPENQFRVIIIEEIGGLLSNTRGEGIKDYFLGVVDGIQNKKPTYILIGTTNNSASIDGGLTRRGRLGKRFILTKPDRNTRVQMFNNRLSTIKKSEEDWSKVPESLASQADNFSYADIVGMIGDAQKKSSLANRDLEIEDFNSESLS